MQEITDCPPAASIAHSVSDPIAASISVQDILAGQGLEVAELVKLPPRKARHESVPSTLDSRLIRQLETDFPKGIYSHQHEALIETLKGKDVCLSTSTASGKSLVFMVSAIDCILKNPGAKVIAFYPMKALSLDQEEKWKAIATQMGIRVGRIDGAVSFNERQAILEESQIIVMTPDVMHAWTMRNLAKTSSMLQAVELIILDEAHVYNGVFGTNLAFLLRRIQVLNDGFRIVASTATLGNGSTFIRELTGREMVFIGHENEGSPCFGKEVLAVATPKRCPDAVVVPLIQNLAQHYKGRFIVFADSRVMVERLASAFASQDDEVDGDSIGALIERSHVMPYRSGYEHDDREKIQEALSSGKLRGVISTSALEMGIDIGDVDLVVMLDAPDSPQSFGNALVEPDENLQARVSSSMVIKK